MTVYYTPSANPPSQSRGTSVTIRTEFISIQAGFTTVNSEMVLKAPLASPTFTGVPAAPTAAAGTNTTQLATTAFVAAAGLNASLPGQVGNTGKFITTDGATASWGSLLKSSVMRWADGSDTTKLMAYDLSGLTGSTTRTITIQNKSGTMALTGDKLQGFASAEQVITANGALTIAHGLGSMPNIVLGFLKCVSAEGNYSIGDVVCMPLGPTTDYVGGNSSHGVSVVPDATNLNVRYGAVFLILDKTSGAMIVTTAAKWTFSLRAYA